jgi:hypothetical protein
MNVKTIAAGAAMAGAVGLGALGFGSGLAQADPHNPPPPPPIPFCTGGPGVNCNGPGTPLPPGQRGAPPPGHWNDPVGYGYPATWIPPNQGVTVPLPLVWNPDVGAWGVFLTPGGPFIVYTP